VGDGSEFIVRFKPELLSDYERFSERGGLL